MPCIIRSSLSCLMSQVRARLPRRAPFHFFHTCRHNLHVRDRLGTPYLQSSRLNKVYHSDLTHNVSQLVCEKSSFWEGRGGGGEFGIIIAAKHGHRHNAYGVMTLPCNVAAAGTLCKKSESGIFGTRSCNPSFRRLSMVVLSANFCIYRHFIRSDGRLCEVADCLGSHGTMRNYAVQLGVLICRTTAP